MKKIFTLVAMATLAFSANAQTESAFINLNVVSEAAVDKNTAESVTRGTELCSTDNVTMKVAYDDTYARIALWGETDAVNTVSVGGVSLALCFHRRVGAAAGGAVERCVLVAGASD